MTVIAIRSTGALPADYRHWDSIPWRQVEKQVSRLQMRIAKATREKRYGKVKALQWLLTHSRFAKFLAVRRVTQNAGRKTAGVDGIIWRSSSQKIQAACALKQKGYQPQPLRRVGIPKKSDHTKVRPLGIPTMRDRAMQALYLLALEPVAETLADRNSYGFRQKRSCADAIEQCFNALAQKSSAQWILEGDIKACFDKISHKWLMENIRMDTNMLHKWLKSGFIEKGAFHNTIEGTPQGGIISPTAANMVLDGMEVLIKSISKPSDKINFVRYADDFVITGNTREVLENKIKPAIESFLKMRGLELSQEKTHITHVDKGFDFLGFNVRKYDGKLLIKPAKKNVLSFLKEIRAYIKLNGSTPVGIIIRKLNQRIRGWANYYRHVVSTQTFSYVDACIFDTLFSWIKRRHPNKSRRWMREKYFRSQGLRNWVFSAKEKNDQGESTSQDLFSASRVRIKRHIKIRSEANPFDPLYKAYFEKRTSRFKSLWDYYRGKAACH